MTKFPPALSVQIVFACVCWRAGELYLHDESQVCHIVFLRLNKLFQNIPATRQMREGISVGVSFYSWKLILQATEVILVSLFFFVEFT